MPRKVKIAAVQMRFGPNVERNLAAMTAAVKRLARRKVDLAVFPECCLSGYVVTPEDRDWKIISAGVAAVRELARVRRMAIIFGTAERNGRKKPFNAALAVDKRGRIVSRYRKNHFFAWDRPLFSAGKRRARVFKLAGIRVAMQICYDLRFPEPARLAAESGAQLIAYSLAAALADPWKKPAMESHVRSRAAENGVFALAANRCHRLMMMRSRIVDPNGLDIVSAPAGRAVELVAEINPAAATRKLLTDRRRDLYQLRGR